MQQMELFESVVPCPCVGICKMDKNGFCIGCARNGDERFLWFRFDNEKKREVHRLCKSRKKRWRFDTGLTSKIEIIPYVEFQYSLFDSECYE